MKFIHVCLLLTFLLSCKSVEQEDKCIVDNCGTGTSNNTTPTPSTPSTPPSSVSTPTVSSPLSNPYNSTGNSVSISGTCVDGATVTLGGADSQTTTCSGSSYSFSYSSSSDGAKTFSVTQTVSGVTSSAASFVWNRDTTAPSAPTISSPASNPYNSAAQSLVLSGACETGAVVTIGGDGSGTYNCSAGVFSFTIDKSAASDGTYTYTLTQADSLGNTSSSTSFNWVINSSNPAPTITTPSTSPYYSNGNTLTIGGACNSGYTVYLTGFTSDSVACSGGLSYSFSPICSLVQVSSCVNDGTYIFSVNQEAGGVPSDAVSKIWVRDTLVPNPIVFASTNPFVSGDNTLSLYGTCEEGATVSLTTNSAINTTCTNGVFNLNINSSCSGSCDYSVKQTDLAGNSSPSVTFTWIYESTMPSTPVITSPTSYQTINGASSFQISGTCTGSNNVILSGTNSTTGVAITTADVTGGSLTKVCSSGLFSFTINRTVDGSYNFSVIQQIPETTNTAAIDSAPASRIWVRDVVNPSAVTIVNPTSPYSNSNPYTAGGDLYISGNCEDYATVTLAGSSSSTTTCSNGYFSFTVSQTTDSSYSYTITQTDRAGNTSTSTSIYWDKDSSIPPAPRILNPSISPYKYNGNSVVISGTCISGLTVTLSGADSQTMTCTNDQFSFTSNQASDGTYAYLVNQGTSPDSAVTWQRDASGPTVTIGGLITEGSTNDNFTSSFTLSANETVQYYLCSLDSGAYSPCVSPVNYDGLSNTIHTLSVKAIDQSGNWGSPTTRTWTQSSNSTIALYHFDSGTTTLTNSSNYGSSNDLTSSSISIVSGKISNALSYSSGTSSVSVAHHSTQSKLNSRMTAEFWFRISSKLSNNKFTPVVTKMGASGSMGWELGLKALGSNDYIVFRGSNNGTTTQEVRSTAVTINTNTWYHVAATYNKGTVRFFMDGVAKGSASVSGSIAADLFNTSATLRIGKTDTSSTTQQFTGLVDEVRLSQIIRYSTNFTPSTTQFSAD